MIRNVLRDSDDVEIVGFAKDGHEALQQIEALSPDLLTLDVQMPDLDGIGVLREIKKRRMAPKAIMVSSLTSEGARVTTDALLEGAFDFVLKPTGGDATKNRSHLQQVLDEKINAFRLSRRKGAHGPSRAPAPEGESERETHGCRAILIGCSTGGPAALNEVLPQLPADLAVPVLVVQHMPPQYTLSLARRLNETCALDVAEAAEGDEVIPGRILIAPGGRHMKLRANGDVTRVSITDDPHENGCRPSVDYLFRTAIDRFDGQALGVIMTGMGRDGLATCQSLKERGGAVFAQDEETSTVYGMPKAIVESGLADRVLPLDRIGLMIKRYVERSRQR